MARLIGTGIGTGLAMLAYLLWPTWEGTSAARSSPGSSLPGRIRQRLLRAYTRPEPGRRGPDSAACSWPPGGPGSTRTPRQTGWPASLTTGR